MTAEDILEAVERALEADRAMSMEATWEVAVGLGLPTMLLTEEQGGLGLGLEAAFAALFALGRSMNQMPLLPALLAAQAAASAPASRARDALTERLAAGEYVTHPLTPHRLDIGQDGRVSGGVTAVLNAAMASCIIVRTTHGPALISLATAGVTVEERHIWDPTRHLFDVRFESVAIETHGLLASGNEAQRVTRALACLEALGIAADSLGAADQSLALTLEYLALRRQFGRPIAMFQAIKHRVADLKVELAAAEALCWDIAGRGVEGEDASAAVAAAALANEAFRNMAEQSIQLHGGIGVTEEIRAHHFLKRAMLNLALGERADDAFAAVGRRLLSGAA